VEDAHSHKEDVVLCYLDFKVPSPLRTIANGSAYLTSWDFPKTSPAWFQTYTLRRPRNCTVWPNPIRGNSKGGPSRGSLPPLLFDLVIEPMIRWLRASQKGYNIASCGLQLVIKCYADDETLVTNMVEDMVVLLDLVDQFSN
jgi:hypothetical protein